MKRRPIPIRTAALAVAVLLFSACDAALSQQQGRLTFHFAGPPATKADIPDTSDFLLKVSNADGHVIYEGVYAQSPEAILVKPGAYTVSATSQAFSAPAFSMPVYGDEQCVVVPPGGAQDVRLECSQTNAGIRLDIKADFLSAFPDGVLLLQGEGGRLVYGFREKRIAYFTPGEVSLMLEADGRQELLLKRTLRAREVLCLGISAPGASAAPARPGHIGIAVDTSRIWTSEDYLVGSAGEQRGSSPETALDIAAARGQAGAKGVWVQGHIVGAFKSSSNAVFSLPAPSETNLIIAPRASAASTENALSVELRKGALRDALNLPANPELRGRKILLKGDLVEAYFGIPGLKNVTDYQLP